MLQRFRQDRDLHAFDRAKPTLIEQSDASDESEDEDDCENIDVKNVEVSQGKPVQTALAAARDQKKTAKYAKDEIVPEFKWWVGGDPNAVERQMQAKKE